MGSFNPFKAAKKAVKGIAGGLKKAVKATVKRVKKVGKAVMRGVAKVSNKLGPLGMIALAVAMPYALGGLSSLVGSPAMAGMGGSGLMGSTNVFLRAVGTVGNTIRTGYGAFNASMSAATSKISTAISNTFTKFAPKGTGNMFSRISEGAKELYTAAKNKVAEYTPDSFKQAYTAGKEKLQSILPKSFTGKEGTVEFYGAADPGVGVMSSTDAAASITKGNLTAGELGKQTLSSKAGFFTSQAGVKGDQIVTDTINEAYKQRLEGFSPDARRYYNDVLNSSKDMGSYINNEEIGNYVENAMSSNQTVAKNGNIFTDTNLGASPDYDVLNEAGDEFVFNGKEAFKSTPAKESLGQVLKKNSKKLIGGLADSMLSKKGQPVEQATPFIPFSDTNMYGSDTGYGATDIIGSSGGSMINTVYGQQAANRMRNYYKNMNILNDMGSY